jgi:hypothetical protein
MYELVRVGHDELVGGMCITALLDLASLST